MRKCAISFSQVFFSLFYTWHAKKFCLFVINFRDQPLVILRKFSPKCSKKEKTKIFVSILLVSYQPHMKIWNAFQTSNLLSVKIKIYVTRLQYYVLIWPLLSAMYALFMSVSGVLVLSQFIMHFMWSIRKQYFPTEG